MRAYGVGGSPRGYELDHLVPLELGGAPSAVANLWPEPIRLAERKDVRENLLHDEVCAGRLVLSVAQERMRRW